MSDFWIVLSLFILFPVIVTFYIIFYYFYKRKNSKYLLQDYSKLIPSDASYEFVGHENLMALSGKMGHKQAAKFKSNIQSLYLVHGTFVGEDPWHIIELLGSVLPEQAESFIDKLKLATKHGQSLVAKDNGNFTQKHISILNKLFKSEVKVKEFTWSSGNHHYARVKGMLDLARELAISHEKGDRILLIGHSHAAQLFALLTKLISNNEFKNLILKFFSEEISRDELVRVIKRCRTFYFDIVTLGSPPRYTWELSADIKLLHFINHRSKDVLGGTYHGAMTTKDGDYIQQWGIAGSDFISPIEKQRRINKELDQYFGPGADRAHFKEQIKYRKRLHNKGHHFLVDYGDQSRFPNFLKTLFGHGVYTRTELLQFHLELIYDFLYFKK